MKPATPLRVLGEGCMKPVTPLRAENGLKLAVLCEQRCQRFQTCAARSSQRCRWFQTCAARSSQWCRWFHLVAVIRPHWCYRFQARWSAGAVRRLWHPSARKSSPCRRKSADFGQFWRCWATFSRACGLVAGEGPGCGDCGGVRSLPPKSRMQFDWEKFQQSLKTLQFQRSKFKV